RASSSSMLTPSSSNAPRSSPSAANSSPSSSSDSGSSIGLARLLGQLGLERRAKIIDLARALTQTGTLGAPAPLGGPPRGRPRVRRRIPRGNPPPTLNTEPSGRLERRAGSPEVPDAS